MVKPQPIQDKSLHVILDSIIGHELWNQEWCQCEYDAKFWLVLSQMSFLFPSSEQIIPDQKLWQEVLISSDQWADLHYAWDNNFPHDLNVK